MTCDKCGHIYEEPTRFADGLCPICALPHLEREVEKAQYEADRLSDELSEAEVVETRARKEYEMAQSKTEDLRDSILALKEGA